MRTAWGIVSALGAVAVAAALSGCASPGGPALAEWAARSAGAVVCTPPDRQTVVPLGRTREPPADVSLVVQCIPPEVR